MDLYDVMTTTFASRDFTDEPLPDDTLFKMLDRARFAPSGGNRQAWRVIVVRDTKTREGLSRAAEPAAKRYVAQERVGEVPWNTIERTQVDTATIERTLAPPQRPSPCLRPRSCLWSRWTSSWSASMDADLDRAAVIPLGQPVKVLTRLKRKPVEEFAMLEKWGGPPLRSPRSRPNG